MDTKLLETIILCVEIMNSKRQVLGETWSRGTNSRLPFDVNVILTVKPSQAYPQDYITEFIIRKLNPLVVVDFRFISAFLHA